MSRGEAATLVFLILFSAVSFLPVWRTLEVAGMALFGWLMAALIVSAAAMILGGYFGPQESPQMLAEIERLHTSDATSV